MIKTESYKKGIITSTILNVIAKGIGFFNIFIIAYYFGSNIQTDIYFFVLATALLITSFINGIDYLVLVPAAMNIRTEEGENSYEQFFNFFIFGYLIIGLLIASVILISPTLFYALFSKFATKDLLSNSKLLYCGSLIIFFQILNNLLSAILMSNKYFSVTIFSSLINSFFAIIFTVVFHKKMNITSTMYGVSAGYALNFILLLITLRRSQNWNFTNFVFMKNKKVWQNIGLMQANLIPLWIKNSIGLFLLSGLGNGVITAVNLGQQISSIPEILLLSQLISITSVKFSELYSQNSLDELNEVFLKISEWGIFITMIITFSSILFSSEITNIIFSNTEINESGLRNIEKVFCLSVSCISVKFIASICTNIVNATQDVKSIFFMSICTHIFVTVATYFLTIKYSLIGYLIGINLHYYIFFFLFYYLIKKTVPNINYKKNFNLVFINILNNIFVFALVWPIHNYILTIINNSYIIIVFGVSIYLIFTIVLNNFIVANKHFNLKKIKLYDNKNSF